MDSSGSLDPNLLRFVRPLSLKPRCETWECTLRGRPMVLRRYGPPRPLDPWPPPPDIEALAPPHPRLERLVDWRSDPDGVVWHLFRWIPGRSLRDLWNDGPMSPDRWLPLLADLAEGLAWLHETGPAAPRLHGDVSPGNLVVTPRGRAVLVDVQARRPGQSGVERGWMAGTIPFVAREVLEGDPPTPASEVSSMGWITGRCLGVLDLPSSSASPREVAKNRRVRLQVLRTDRRDLAHLVEAMLSPDPRDRPTAREVFREVRRIRRRQVPREA